MLLVEDNQLNAEIAAELLRMSGLTVDCAWDGIEAVDCLANCPDGYYDMVFMDIQMPRMNGLEASRTIRGGSNPLGQTIPIIAMTANAFTEDIRDCLNAGMDAHVSKPIDIAVLERTLRNLMAENAGGGQNPETGDGIDLIERP